MRLLNPCNVCYFSEHNCEQCIFGYISEQEAHERFKDTILKTINGEKPTGQRLAQRYMEKNPKWREECGIEEVLNMTVTEKQQIANKILSSVDTDDQKLYEIFELYKDDLRKFNVNVYYALLGWKDAHHKELG